ncbi:ribosomal RNA processing protein 1 homolog A [Oreochromis aureus]|uniref:Ribosomal RNA processing 1 n=1 Tax=Oreochromis aureus TaxID=47969 RepID=A0A668T6K2_OREAU|nr:ribosomal RNA processing protein 1 homolog A [Oreochromis aureus]
MADQQAEVQLAQRLASNEKPVRTRAMKKLRKYVSLRSQKGEFSGEELLKLWKGLFYCLWMQDKPLLQEELSRKISTLIHSFTSTQQQLSYLRSFLQTMKREWTGIDRLRMDKFFQLVRFVFRQTFEVLRRRSWDSSAVSQFLELLTAQLLQSDAAAPSGLQLHVLDLYLTELAAVGAAELTADQNLTFIEPFCRTAARTKDRTLLSGICSSVFSAIIDQAPFAIDDLMKEVRASEYSDSGQASEGDEEEEGEEKTMKMEAGRKQLNGNKDDDDDDEFLHLENLDSDSPRDEDVGPVLQFDYSALADKLLEVSGRSGVPAANRERLYKIIKTLRDLSEGVFPQDEYPEEVSTDEDDDMFGSRKRMKKRRRHLEEEEPAAKKGEKEAEEDTDAADVTAENKKKRKKGVKAGTGRCEASGEELAAPQSDMATPAKKKRKRRKAEGTTGQPEQKQTAQEEGRTPSGTLHSEASPPPDHRDQPQKKKQKSTETPPTTEPQVSSARALISEKKGVTADTGSCEASREEVSAPPPQSDFTTPAKKKKKMAAEAAPPLSVRSSESDETPAAGSDALTPAKKSIPADEEQAAEAPQLAKKKTKKKGKEEMTAGVTAAETPQKKKKKKDQQEAPEEDEGQKEARTTPGKKKKKKNSVTHEAAEKQVGGEAGDAVASSDRETPAKKKRKIPVVFEFEADELQTMNGITAEEETATKKPRRTNDDVATPLSNKTPQKKKRKSAGGSQSDFITFQSNAKAPTPLFCKTKGSPSTPASSRKKLQTPKSDSKKVTFGLKNNKTAEFRKTDRSLLVSPDGSSRVPFDPQQKPKFGVLKAPPTPLSANVKRTPAGNKKGGTPRSTPKRRVVASDFF